MSVNPATDEQIERWKGTWLQSVTCTFFYSDNGEPETMGAMLEMVFARIEQDAETIRALTTRAEEAEALLREALPEVWNNGDGCSYWSEHAKDQGVREANAEEAERLLDLRERIEAHLQEHTDG